MAERFGGGGGGGSRRGGSGSGGGGFGGKKPYVRRDASAGSSSGPRKPYAPRGDKPAYAPRGDRPYTPRGDKPAFSARKPYTPREDGERKPYAPRGDRPYTPRGDKPAFGARKPYTPREGGVSQRDQSLQEHSGLTGDGKPARFDARRESARRPRPQNVSDKKPWREQRESIVRDPAGGDGWLVGVHPVMAALTAGRRAVRELWLLAEPKAALADLIAANPQWLVLTKTRPDFDAQFGEAVAHQGVALLAGNLPQPSLPDVLSRKPTLLVALDQVTDPHNVGAIVRSAGAFGAAAVLHTEHRSAGLTPVVAKVAAGTLEVVPLVEIVNLVQSLELLKEAGFTVIGLAGEAEHATLQEVLPTLTGPVCVVLGSEGDGLRRLTRETCDHLVRLPISPLVESLNVSVAAGVTLSMLNKGSL